MGQIRISIHQDKLPKSCRRCHICQLSLFGSIRDDFRDRIITGAEVLDVAT